MYRFQLVRHHLLVYHLSLYVRVQLLIIVLWRIVYFIVHLCVSADENDNILDEEEYASFVKAIGEHEW